MTLYRDPAVKWAGMEVGGIRISHMTDIGENMTMALTVTRANKKPFTVRPLTSAAQPSNAAASKSPPATPSGDAAAPKPSPQLAAVLDAISTVKGKNTAQTVQEMIAELTSDFERDFAQLEFDARVRELKAKSQTRRDADARVSELESDKL